MPQVYMVLKKVEIPLGNVHYTNCNLINEYCYVQRAIGNFYQR
ncbi:hypothetical protein VCRA2113O23_40076 [Vibrio crassostreae]|nr:hypothetical protein VCRA2113O23_40076 [Vibrio crassostreae]